MSDGEVSKLLIVTQTPQRPKKHDGFDRTAEPVSKVKMSQVRATPKLLYFFCFLSL